MYNNYGYMRDALDELPLTFSDSEIDWLKKKNKRRFSVHLINHLRRTRNFKQTKEAFLKASFSMKDLLEGICYFQKQPKQLSTKQHQAK